MPTFQFDEDTSLADAGDGKFRAELPQRWTIDGGRPNGGFLLALLGRAAVEAAGGPGGPHPHPVAATSQYMTAPSVGPAEVRAEVMRRGRTATQVRCLLVQDDEAKVAASFVVGRLAGGDPLWSTESPFALPAPEDCVSMRRMMPPGVTTMRDSIEVRYDPATLFIPAGMDGPEGHASEPAVLRAWLSFADGRPFDPVGLLLAADGLPPAVTGLGLAGWVPTLQLTAYVRGLPAPGPLRVRQSTRVAVDGLLDEVCEVWDDDGRLVAQASQLAAYRPPQG
ncbi:MAG TPA: thioesterase family protein [Acidimicrobiales bacterium]|nr:thioesterase family protein [Acidimicrobiales bacterium]